MRRQLETHCRMIGAKAPHSGVSHRASSEARGDGLFIPVSSPVATFEQSENHCTLVLVGAACFAKVCGLCNRFHLRMRTVLMGTLAQAGYCLCMNYVSMFCEHVLLINDHAC